jgi:hypothetical protein
MFRDWAKTEAAEEELRQQVSPIFFLPRKRYIFLKIMMDFTEI